MLKIISIKLEYLIGSKREGKIKLPITLFILIDFILF